MMNHHSAGNAAALNAQTAATPLLKDATAFDEAELAFELAREMSSKVIEIVGLIAGTVPEAGEAKSAVSSIPNGRLDLLKDGSFKAKAAMRHAMQALDRLQGAI